MLNVLNSSEENSLEVPEVLQVQCLLWDQLDPEYKHQLWMRLQIGEYLLATH